MIWLILIFSLMLAALDRAVARRLCRDPRHRRRLFAAMLVADALPFLSSAAAFVFARDNTTAVMMFSMWVFFAYMIAAVARLPFGLAVVLSRRRWVRAAGAAASAACAALFVYGAAVTRTDYVVNRVEIVSDRLPSSFDGYTVVQISDLHLGTMLRPQRELRCIAEICNAQDADMIAFCGDLVNIRYSEIDGTAAAELSRLHAADGVFSVTGNHDVGDYIRDSLSLPAEENTRRLLAAQRALGWRTLDDQTVYVRRGGDSISVSGISFDRGLKDFRHSRRLPEADLAAVFDGVPRGSFNIALVHIPQLWDAVVDAGFGDLTLSGHVHAMQMKAPVGERGLSPAMLRYERWSGLYSERGRNLYVNDGIGCVLFPMRLGARPEITVFVLRSAHGSR